MLFAFRPRRRNSPVTLVGLIYAIANASYMDDEGAERKQVRAGIRFRDEGLYSEVVSIPSDHPLNLTRHKKNCEGDWETARWSRYRDFGNLNARPAARRATCPESPHIVPNLGQSFAPANPRVGQNNPPMSPSAR